MSMAPKSLGWSIAEERERGKEREILSDAYVWYVTNACGASITSENICNLGSLDLEPISCHPSHSHKPNMNETPVTCSANFDHRHFVV